jgi:hypothetical protein
MTSFRQALATQRWDDHRFYHHSLVNQSLHLASAASFLCSYVLLFTNPAMAALIAWLVAMTTRQAGHFLFEPKGYDHVNQVTHEYKEQVKVGYNLRRKVVLLSIWIASPLLLALDPSLFGLLEPHGSTAQLFESVGWIWLAVGLGGLLFRTLHLFYLEDVRTGLVWFTKILTDPIHDIKLYHKAPLYLMRGERPEPPTAAAAQ